MFSKKSLPTDIYYLVRLYYVPPRGSRFWNYLSEQGSLGNPPSRSSFWNNEDRKEEKSVCL